MSGAEPPRGDLRALREEAQRVVDSISAALQSIRDPVREALRATSESVERLRAAYEGIWERLPAVWQHYVDDQILLAKANYDTDGNPLYVFECFWFLRQIGHPIPEWVLEYFEHSAEKLLAIPGNPTSPSSAIAEALGMKKPGRSGAGNVFSTYRREQQPKWMLYALLVADGDSARCQGPKACRATRLQKRGEGDRRVQVNCSP